jgi:hypothetical protein
MFEFEREKLAIAIEALQQAKQSLSKAAIEDEDLFQLVSMLHGLVGKEGAVVLFEKSLARRAAR